MYGLGSIVEEIGYKYGLEAIEDVLNYEEYEKSKSWASCNTQHVPTLEGTSRNELEQYILGVLAHRSMSECDRHEPTPHNFDDEDSCIRDDREECE